MASESHSAQNLNEAVSFLINRSDLGPRYDPGRDQFVDSTDSEDYKNRLDLIWEDANAEMEKLNSAIDKYQGKLAKANGAQEKQPEVRKRKWKKIFKDVDSAVKLYQEEPMTGPKGVVKKALHKLKDKGKILEHWCSLLPGGDYTGSVAGVFQMVITAAKRMDDVRDCIFEAMQDIPDYLRRTGEFLKIYRTNRIVELEEKSAELCKTILVLLRQIVEILTHGSTVRALQALAQGEGYEQDIEKSKREVKRLAKNIGKEAELCHQARMRDLLEHQDKIYSVVKRNEEDNAVIKSLLADGQTSLSQMFQRLYAMLVSNSNFDAKTGRARLLEIGPSEAGGGAETSAPSSPKPSKQRKKLLKLLQFNPESREEDLEECRQLQETLGIRAKDEATWVVRSKELFTWLTSRESADLLINGNRPDAAMDRVSPLSLVCAELTRLCGAAHNAVVASYFCGLHDDDGPADMMASLIGQIVSQCKDGRFSDILSLFKAEDADEAPPRDLKAFCKAFKKLFHQLPNNVVLFCILDGVSLFEIQDESGTVLVLETLSSVVSRRKRSAVFKLLLTSPHDSLNVGSLWDGSRVNVGDVLVVPEYVDGDRHGVWNVQQLEETFPWLGMAG